MYRNRNTSRVSGVARGGAEGVDRPDSSQKEAAKMGVTDKVDIRHLMTF